MNWILRSEGSARNDQRLDIMDRYSFCQKDLHNAEADLCRALDALQEELEWLQSTVIYWRPESRKRAYDRIATLAKFIEPFKKK